MDRNEFHVDNFCPCMLQDDLSSSGNRMIIKVQQSVYFFYRIICREQLLPTTYIYMETHYLTWVTTGMRFNHHRVGYTKQRNSSLQVFYLQLTRWVMIRM